MKKTLIGKVISSKMTGSVVVAVSTSRMHPLYKKSLNKTSKFHVANTIEAKTGDLVKIEETRPASKTIHFKTISIVRARNVKTDAPVKKTKTKDKKPKTSPKANRL